MSAIHNIPLSKIVPGDNDRKVFSDVDIQALADDIAANGLTSPITVRPMGDGYEIVAGERRYRAHIHLRASTIAAFIRDLSDEDAARIMLSESMCRVNLNPIEESMAVRKHMDKFGWSAKRVAEECNLSEQLVNRRLCLLLLMPVIQKLVAGGQLPLGIAESMTILDPNNQVVALKGYQERPCSVSVFRKVCSQLAEQASSNTMFDLNELFVQLRDEYEKPHAKRESYEDLRKRAERAERAEEEARKLRERAVKAEEEAHKLRERAVKAEEEARKLLHARQPVQQQPSVPKNERVELERQRVALDNERRELRQQWEMFEKERIRLAKWAKEHGI